MLSYLSLCKTLTNWKWIVPKTVNDWRRLMPSRATWNSACGYFVLHSKFCVWRKARVYALVLWVSDEEAKRTFLHQIQCTPGVHHNLSLILFSRYFSCPHEISTGSCRGHMAGQLAASRPACKRLIVTLLLFSVFHLMQRLHVPRFQ